MAEARTPLLGLAGLAIGSLPGGVSLMGGLQYGLLAGSLLDTVLPPPGPRQRRGQIDEFRVNGMSQGTPIPIVWGRYRLPALIIHPPVFRTSTETTRVGGKGGGAVEEVMYSADLAFAVCQGPIHSVRRIWANREVIWDNRTGTPITPDWLDAGSITFYTGSEAQTPDSLLAAGVPTGELPAYRSLAYVVIEELPLSRFGRAIPQLEVEVQTTSGGTVALDVVASDLAALMGVPGSRCDFSALSGVTVRGAAVTARQQASAVWQVLQDAFQFDLYESGGLLKARRWGNAPEARLSEAQAGLWGDPGYCAITTTQDSELPRRVELAYVSEDLDFQRYTQSARISTAGTEEPLTIELPVVMGRDDAARLAMIHLLRRRVQSVGITVRGLPSLLRWEPTDVLTVPSDIGDVTAKVTSMGWAEDGSVQLTMVEDDPTIYSQPDIYGAPEIGGGQTVSAPSSPVWVLRSDLPALTDADAASPNAFGWGSSSKPGWAGGVIKWSGGDPRAYLAQDIAIPSSGVVGETVSALPAGAPWQWDTTSTVDVQVYSGSLVSVSELDALNWSNLCMIGDELLIFRTATLIGTNTYRLSNLLRGVRGTEDRILSPSRASGARFALASYARRGQVWSDWSKPFDHAYAGQARAWTSGTDPNLSVTLTDGTLRPYAPCHMAVETLVGGDRRVTWTRRARRFGHANCGINVPLDYDSERYALMLCGTGVSLDSVGRFKWTGGGVLQRGFDAGGEIDSATWLSAPEIVIPAATWSGIAGSKRIGICQIGVLGSLNYQGFGRPLVMDWP